MRAQNRAIHTTRHRRAHNAVGHSGHRGRRGHTGSLHRASGSHLLHSGSGHHRHNHYAHSYYRRHGFYLNFHFGSGLYYGFRYYSPYYDYAARRHYAFFYPSAVTYCYVPYGFYTSSSAVYVTRDNARPDYEADEYTPQDALDADEEKKLAPEPAVPSPTTERYLREASEAFGKADYRVAAEKFRLAAVAAPDEAGPLFAFAQALIALEKDDYAARVLRRALRLRPDLLKETADIVGVYKDRAEFDRVLAALQTRADAAAPDGDARFLLGLERFLSGDPSANDIVNPLRKQLPTDPAIAALAAACQVRFKAAEDLPAIK